ncbi:MAG TPA: MFS transporter [Acidimicrobiales bacterium]|nr:MFS transporter [Acidimicrobiales bacterium]
MRLNEWAGALRERNFRLFFIGQTTSQIGSGMAPVAIAFAVLQHGTASDLGLVSAAGFVPLVVLLLAGGVIADGFSRRVVMLSSDLLRTSAEIGLGAWILVASPPLWGFMTLAGVVGVGSAFFNPALTGLVPQVVSEGKLLQANALNSLSGSSASIIGPALAGVIVAVSSPGWAVLIDGLTYAVSVLSLYLIRVEWAPSASVETFTSQLRTGWSEFWSRTWLWVIVIEFSCVNVLVLAPMFVLGPVIAKQSLGGAPAWGLILALEGAGSVLGGVVMLRWDPVRPLLTATLATTTWVIPLIGLAARAPALFIGFGEFVAGIGLSVFGTLWTTTMQREIPAEVLSRVSAYDWFGSLVFLPIGMALVGPIAKVAGMTTTIIGATVLLALCIGATLLVPSVTGMRSPTPK